MLRCINYRCRLKAVAVDSTRLAEIRAYTGKQGIYYEFDWSHKFPLSQLYYLRFRGVFESSQTFFPVPLETRVWSIPKRVAFVALGSVGLGLTAAVFGLYPSRSVRPTAIVGLCCTMLFVGLALSLYHRVACRAIIFSFDFAFLSLQISACFWSTAMLFGWDARVLFLAAQLCVAVEVLWRDRWALMDRVVFSLVGGRMELRLLPFFLSRLVMTFFWSLRLLWRAATSGEGDAIVQIGRVGFMYTDVVSQPSMVLTKAVNAAKAVLTVKRTSISDPAVSGPLTKPSSSQVAPVTTFTPT